MKILNYINRTLEKKEKALLIICLTVFTAFLMSLMLFEKSSSIIEKTVLKSVDIRFEIVNDHIFSGNNRNYQMMLNSIHPNDAKQYLLKCIDELEKLSNQDSITYSNYNLIVRNYGLTHETEDELAFNSYILYGIDRGSIGNNQSYNLTEGRFFSDEELEKGNHVVIVPEDAYVVSEGNRRQVKVGDVIEVGTYYDSGILSPIEFYDDNAHWSVHKKNYAVSAEVIGTYCPVYHYDFQNGIGDAFYTESRILAPNETVLEIIKRSDFTRYASADDKDLGLRINSITFGTDDYENYTDTEKQVKQVFNRLENEFSSTVDKEHQIRFEFVHHDYETLLDSLRTVCYIYKTIFMIAIVLTVILLGILNAYFQSKRARTIRIYLLNGTTPRRILRDYIGYYLLIGAACRITGGVCGLFISKALMNLLVDNVLKIQTELGMLENGIVTNYSSLSGLTTYFNTGKCLNTLCVTALIVETVSVLIITVSSSSVFTKRIYTKLNED